MREIRMPWRSQLRRPSDAPRDGSRFFGIAKGKTRPMHLVWDAEMGCFLSTEFDCVDELACWWPESAAAHPLQRPAA